MQVVADMGAFRRGRVRGTPTGGLELAVEVLGVHDQCYRCRQGIDDPGIGGGETVALGRPD
ncbi:hypothetical protein F6Q10_04615 [Streptomyces vinaceus]|nr:hypothetical protein [Streptomyces vinaceus]